MEPLISRVKVIEIARPEQQQSKETARNTLTAVEEFYERVYGYVPGDPRLPALAD